MSIYRQENSPYWYLNISRPGFPRIRESTGTTDRQEAQRIHDERKAALWKLKAPLAGRTWGAAVKLWLAAATRSDSELYSLRKLARTMGDCYIHEVDADRVDRALAFCNTAGTYMRYRTMIHAILVVAKKEGWLEEVPRLRTRKGKPKPRKWLTPAQWEKLYVCLPAHQRPAADLGLQTGLRQSNVLGLTWDRVDLKRRLIWVEAEDMKGGEAAAIPLNDRAVEILTLRHNMPDKHPVYVFTFRGAPIKDIKTGFQAACVKAGLGRYVKTDEGNKYEGFTWHGLRHTFATWHTQNGTPAGVLKELGAWKDARMVETYAHHSPGYIAQFANNLNKRTP